MTHSGNGRHCSACAKTVVDFTKMSDAQVRSYVNRNDNLCGRFSKAQLGRDLNVQIPILTDFNVVIRKSLFGFGISALTIGGMHGQSVPPQDSVIEVNRKARTPHFPQQVTSPQALGEPLISEKEVFPIVSGVVTDAHGEPLIGANVRIVGTALGAATDLDGNFMLEDLDKNASLEISYIGYTTQHIQGLSDSINIVLEEGTLGVAVMVGLIVQRRSLPARLIGWKGGYRLLRGANKIGDFTRKMGREVKRILSVKDTAQPPQTLPELSNRNEPTYSDTEQLVETQLFPNPTTGRFTIVRQSESVLSLVNVYSITGQLVYATMIETQSLAEVSEGKTTLELPQVLPEGMYVVEGLDADGQFLFSSKIVLMRYD